MIAIDYAALHQFDVVAPFAAAIQITVIVCLVAVLSAIAALVIGDRT